jgi:hypothetical protein
MAILVAGVMGKPCYSPCSESHWYLVRMTHSERHQIHSWLSKDSWEPRTQAILRHGRHPAYHESCRIWHHVGVREVCGSSGHCWFAISPIVMQEPGFGSAWFWAITGALPSWVFEPALVGFVPDWSSLSPSCDWSYCNPFDWKVICENWRNEWQQKRDLRLTSAYQTKKKRKSRRNEKWRKAFFYICIHLLKYALGNGTSRSTSREKFYRIL